VGPRFCIWDSLGNYKPNNNRRASLEGDTPTVYLTYLLLLVGRRVLWWNVCVCGGGGTNV
jgi:hypothetical protein